MLLLTFRVAEGLYAVPVERVVEVVPRVELRAIPHAPGFLLGLLSYRGRVVPVIDLGLLLGTEACREGLDTRIILIGQPAAWGRHLLGMVAERVSDVRPAREDEVALPSLRLAEAPYLGAVLRTDEGLVQVLEPGEILPEALREALFGRPSEA